VLGSVQVGWSDCIMLFLDYVTSYSMYFDTCFYEAMPFLQW